MARLSRRRFLAASAATLPFTQWLGAQAQTTPLKRHAVGTSEGDAMLVIYRDAVKLMMDRAQKDPGDPLGWTFQWYTHAVPRNKAVEIRRVYGNQTSANRRAAEQMWSTCAPHFGQPADLFLPWHRMYGLYFERIVRHLTGKATFTLPYWDYSNTTRAALPEAFRRPADAGNPLYRPDRFDDINGGARLTIDLTAMMEREYSPFCSGVDNSPHGAVHVDIGTDVGMGRVPWAANDPIFWLHHCSIDHIWASWNVAGGSNSMSSTTLAREFSFFDATSGRVVKAKVSDVLSTQQCGYVYDRDLPRPPGSPSFSTPVATPSTRLLNATVRVAPTVTLTSAPTTLALRARPTPGTPALTGLVGPTLFNSQLAAADNRPLSLKITKIQAESAKPPPYDVYLDLPGGVSPRRDDPSYVGTIHFFGAAPEGDAHHDNHARIRDLSFVVTDNVRRLRQMGRMTGEPILTLVPRVPSAATTKVTIGGVALVSG